MSVHTDIKSAIKAHITAITGIKNVYGFEKGDLNGYPSAVVLLEAIESNIDSTFQNERKYTYKVKVYQEFEGDSLGAEAAETLIDGLIDTIIGKFEVDFTLGGLVHKVDIKGVTGYLDRGNGTRVIEMTLDCFTLVTIS